MSTARFETLKTSELVVDHEVQRDFNERHPAIRTEFNDDALGVITVSRRKRSGGKNVHVIVDGQHRWEAAKRNGVELLDCKVYEGLTKEDEAALFRVLNNTRIVNSYDRFRVRVVEGDPDAVTMNKYLLDAGWFVSSSPHQKGAFRPVVALEKVYNGAGIRPDTKQPDAVRILLQVLTAAWGHDQHTTADSLIRGVGAFLVRHYHQVDLTKVVSSLESYPGGPVRMVADAKVLRSMRSMSTGDAVADILTGIYNRRRSVNRLPEWVNKAAAREAESTGADDEG